jgi:hypothetical protein
MKYCVKAAEIQNRDIILRYINNGRALFRVIMFFSFRRQAVSAVLNNVVFIYNYRIMID